MNLDDLLTQGIKPEILQQTNTDLLKLFSQSYFSFLNNQKQYYLKLLEDYKFHYIKKITEKNYADEILEKDMAAWLVIGLDDFLQSGEIEVLGDEFAIAKKQANITFNLFANQEAYKKTTKTSFFKPHETIELFQNPYFNELLKNATSIKKIKVRKLNENAREYFSEKELDEEDVIFTKQNIKKYPEIKKTNTIVPNTKFLTPETVNENTKKFRHEPGKENERRIYDAMSILKERKEQGIIISYNDAIEEITKLNKLANNGSQKKEFINFIKTDQGKNLLTYGGPITNAFTRTLNNLSETIMLFYKK